MAKSRKSKKNTETPVVTARLAPPNPPRPRMPLLVAAAGLLVVWLGVLVYLAYFI